jgi:hypothetical protein
MNMNPILTEASRRMAEASNMFRQACEAHSAGCFDVAAGLYNQVNTKLREASDLYGQGSRNAEWTVDEILAHAG